MERQVTQCGYCPIPVTTGEPLVLWRGKWFHLVCFNLFVIEALKERRR